MYPVGHLVFFLVTATFTVFDPRLQVIEASFWVAEI